MDTQHAFRAELIEQISLSEIRPAPRNARTHSKRQIRQIAASIAKIALHYG